jgi:hypothetical protein
MEVGGLLDYDDDDLEDDELPSSSQVCHSCQDYLKYTDEIFVFTVSSIQVSASGMFFPPRLSEDGSDYLLEPIFVCFSCCEGAMEELAEEYADIPPVEDLYAVHVCVNCGSGMRNQETAVVVCFGEIHLSHREPNGVGGQERFEGMDLEPDVLCLPCTNKLSEDLLPDLWSAPLSQQGECSGGTYARCWKYGCNTQDDCDNCE